MTEKEPLFRANALDRAITAISPLWGMKRLRHRAMMAVGESYIGASLSRKSFRGWSTKSGDANTDTLYDLPMLRERSRDLRRNSTIAAGAAKTKITNIIGSGLVLHPHIDRAAIGISEEDADKWEDKTKREWELFFESQEVDAARTLNGYGHQRQAYDQYLTNGDVFSVFKNFKRIGSPYNTKLQLIEADRVCNEGFSPDSLELAGGVKKDINGAPIEYHILKQHPGGLIKSYEWVKIPAFGEKTGLRNIIHFARFERPGQTRGIPDFAPVIEALKQLSRYSEAELAAAVIAAFFTVFVTTESEGFAPDSSIGGDKTDEPYRLGKGGVVTLKSGESVSTVNPGRPNSGFDPFVVAIYRQIGVALELPYELLIKHFQSSYSAARAALLEAWKYFSSERQLFTDNYCRIIYEAWMYEAVALGRIVAPGFFSDPIIRRAYLGSDWVGPAKGMIDELDEIRAAEERWKYGVSTLSEITAEMTGGDWEQKWPQIQKEIRMMQEARKAEVETIALEEKTRRQKEEGL